MPRRNQKLMVLDRRQEIVVADLYELKSLIKIANSLDEKGLYKESDAIDEVIIAIAQGGWAESFRQGIQDFGDRATQGVQDLVGGVGKSLTGVAAQIASTLGGGLDSAISAWEAAGHQIEELQKLIEQFGKNAVAAVLKMWQKVLSAGALAANVMKDFVMKMIYFALIPVVMTIMGLAAGAAILVAIYNAARRAGVQAVTAALQKIDQAAKAGWQQFEKFIEVFNGVMNGTLQWANNEWRAIQAGAGAAVAAGVNQYNASSSQSTSPQPSNGSTAGASANRASQAVSGPRLLNIGDPNYLYSLTADGRGYIAYNKSDRKARVGTDGRPRVFSDAAGLAKVKAGRPA